MHDTLFKSTIRFESWYMDHGAIFGSDPTPPPRQPDNVAEAWAAFDRQWDMILQPRLCAYVLNKTALRTRAWLRTLSIWPVST